MEMKKKNYGMHLTMRLAGITCKEVLFDEKLLEQCIKYLVDQIGMRILKGPLAAKEYSSFEKRGCSVVVILYESHVAIHTYSNLGEAFIDVFSCREFNVQTIIKSLNRFLGDFEIIEKNIFSRGAQWGIKIDKEMEKWQNQK